MVAKKEDNLIPQAHVLTLEEQSAGGIASGKARQEKATMKKTLEMLLEETNSKGKKYKDLVTLGLLKGAINGNASNYRTILETLGELNVLGSEQAHPTLKIEISDNSSLEKAMYEENQPKQDDVR